MRGGARQSERKRGGCAHGSSRSWALCTRRAAGALKAMGVQPEQRVALVMLDGVDFPATFLGAIKLGAVPVPLNTMLTPEDYTYMLRDSRARAVIASAALYEK